jgi:hypothetical protein
MNQNSIKNLPKLRNENYENIFQIYTDEEGMYYYNILQTISLPSNLPEGYFQYYNVQYGDTWPLISYKNYKTPNLWWAILPFNNILDPTKIPENSTRIKVLKIQFLRSVLNEITTQNAK